MRNRRTQKSPAVKKERPASNVGVTREQSTLLPGAEDARREAERKYRDIFENAVEGIFQTAPDGGFITANPALAHMLGFETPEELIRARTDIEGAHYVHPERRFEFKRLLDQHDTVRGFEFEAYRKDGTKIWMSDNVRAVRDATGKLLYYEGTVEDITERKRAEEALRDAEREYRDIYENAVEGIFQIKPGGGYISANPALARMLGFDSTEELISELSDPAKVRYINPQRHDEYLRRLAEEGVLRDFEYQDYRKEGSTIWLSDNVRAVRDSEGTLLYYQGTTQDITSRKLAEHALRESEERYRELFENSKDAIYVHDLKGRYTSLNRAAEKLSGYSREEILGKHFSNFVAPGSLKDVRENLCKKLDEVGETVYEIDLITKDRRRVPVEVNSRLIYENGVPIGVQGTASDITERRRAQEALRTYSRRLMEVQEAERQNVARELHDQIGQILTAVRINLQSIQRSGRTPDGVPSLEESIGIVDEALGRVRELSIELRPSLLDDLGLSTALRWYVDRFAQRTGIIAEVSNGFEDDSRLPRELETACFRIAQEALTNVARHAQAVSVSVQVDRSRERILLTIMDDGVGFDLDNLRKSASTVSALGLRGMEERALAVGGYVRIESGSGRGTRVRATFPLQRK